MAKPIEVTERLRQHVEASIKRDDWARRAIDLLAKGKEKAGLAPQLRKRSGGSERRRRCCRESLLSTGIRG